MSKAEKDYYWFKENPAQELADHRKRFWCDRQWGWYTILKFSAWNNDPQGKLPNNPAMLQKIAFAQLKNKKDEQLWADVIAVFKIEGEWLVHPTLIANSKDKNKEGTKKEISGTIGGLKNSIKNLPPEDPRRIEAEKRILELQAKTAKGKKAGLVAPQTKTTAPRSSKSAASRGRADSNVPDEPELVPAIVEKSTSTKYADIEKDLGPLQVKNGKTLWNGQWWYPGELQKQLKLLQDKLAKKRTDLDRSKKGSTAYAQCLHSLAEIKRAIAECEFCLGVLPKDTPAPEPLPVKTPAGQSPSEEASNIEAISDPVKLRALEREFIGRVEEWKNPSEDKRSIAYTAAGKLSSFGRKRLEAAESALEKVRNRMADLGVSAAN